MSQVAEHGAASKPEAAAYGTNWEYLSDELRCLDIYLHRLVLRQRHGQPADPLRPFTGLVISEEEIIELLTDEAGADGRHPGPAATQQRDLTQAATRLEQEIGERRAASL